MLILPQGALCWVSVGDGVGFSKTLRPVGPVGPVLVEGEAEVAPGDISGLGWQPLESRVEACINAGQARQGAGLWVKSCLFSEFVENQGPAKTVPFTPCQAWLPSVAAAMAVTPDDQLLLGVPHNMAAHTTPFPEASAGFE